jgi:hypothetical protein
LEEAATPVWVAIMIVVAATSLMNFGMALQKKGAAFAAMLTGMVLLGLSATDEGMPPLPEWPPLLGVTAAVLGLSAFTCVLGKRGVPAGIRTDSLLGMVSGLFIGLAALYTKAMFTFKG